MHNMKYNDDLVFNNITVFQNMNSNDAVHTNSMKSPKYKDFDNSKNSLTFGKDSENNLHQLDPKILISEEND